MTMETKTMTCKELAGPCDHAMTAATSDEMMGKGMEHLKGTHPELAAEIESTPKDDPKMVGWYDKFMKDWEAKAPDA